MSLEQKKIKIKCNKIKFGVISKSLHLASLTKNVILIIDFNCLRSSIELEPRSLEYEFCLTQAFFEDCVAIS